VSERKLVRHSNRHMMSICRDVPPRPCLQCKTSLSLSLIVMLYTSPSLSPSMVYPTAEAQKMASREMPDISLVSRNVLHPLCLPTVCFVAIVVVGRGRII